MILLCALVSCGKRDAERELENYLDGRWRLKELNCYKDTTVPTETYQLPDTYDVIFDFNGREVTYSVSPKCNITTTGEYIISHVTFTSGEASMVNMLGGGTCTDSIGDDRGAGSATVDLEVTSSHTSNLLWSYDKDTKLLTMTFPTAFKGTSNINFCNASCVCSGVFVED